MKFSELYLRFHNFCEIWLSFSRTPMRNFLWCYYIWLITSSTLQKCKKNAIFFKLFWHKVFVHWELQSFNFLVHSVLISFERFSLKDYDWAFSRAGNWGEGKAKRPLSPLFLSLRYFRPPPPPTKKPDSLFTGYDWTCSYLWSHILRYSLRIK